MRLKKIIGKSMMAIQRKSYRMPSKKEGSKSPKERSRGLKAKNVANRNNVNISRKMKNRFITQRTVFGIFNLISIRVSRVVVRPVKKGVQKKAISVV